MITANTGSNIINKILGCLLFFGLVVNANAKTERESSTTYPFMLNSIETMITLESGLQYYAKECKTEEGTVDIYQRKQNLILAQDRIDTAILEIAQERSINDLTAKQYVEVISKGLKLLSKNVKLETDITQTMIDADCFANTIRYQQTLTAGQKEKAKYYSNVIGQIPNYLSSLLASNAVLIDDLMRADATLSYFIRKPTESLNPKGKIEFTLSDDERTALKNKLYAGFSKDIDLLTNNGKISSKIGGSAWILWSALTYDTYEEFNFRTKP